MKKTFTFLCLSSSLFSMEVNEKMGHHSCYAGPTTTQTIPAALYTADQQRIIALNWNERELQVYSATAPYECIARVENKGVIPTTNSASLSYQSKQGLIATIAGNKLVVRDMATLRTSHELANDENTTFSSLDFSQCDSGRIVSSYNKKANLNDLRMERPVIQFTSQKKIAATKFNPTGNNLVVVGATTKLYDVRYYKDPYAFFPEASKVTYNNQGSLLALAGTDEKDNSWLKIVDVKEDLAIKERMSLYNLKNHAYIYALAFSCDDTQLAFSDSNYRIFFKSLQNTNAFSHNFSDSESDSEDTGDNPSELIVAPIAEEGMNFYSLQFNNEGTSLLSAGDNLFAQPPHDTTIRIWDAPTERSED